FVVIIFVLFIHPPIAIFVFAMSYLIWGIIENIYLLIKRTRMKQNPEAGSQESDRLDHSTH
ncbi:MAG TPA: hypothetical protein VN328_01815, partial [Thermodesulfovibrionales bacterium]|nr:hypothetical protein [Thermodesulfovibrionales bacterium]